MRWGGQPEKSLVVGPHGHRLTPRGSFDEWREVVSGTAEPWSPGLLAVAQRLLAEMYRASSRRHAELDRLRAQLLAVLGHDLRDPLHAIKLAAQVMDRGSAPHPLGRRIQASSSRMRALSSCDKGRAASDADAAVAASSDRTSRANRTMSATSAGSISTNAPCDGALTARRQAQAWRDRPRDSSSAR